VKLLLLVALAGCFPTSTTVIRTTDRKLALEPQATGPIQLATERSGNVLIVTAVASRRCRGTVTDQVVTREQTTYALLGTSNGRRWGYGVVAGMILLYPIGIGVGVISGVTMLAQPPRDQTTSPRSEVVGHIDRPCNVRAANASVDIAWSSGASTTSVTDEAGQLVLLLPANEPAPRITSSGGVAVPIQAAPPPQEPAPEREPPRPLATEIPPARDPAITNATRTARARARAGDCALVKQIGETVRLRDLDYYLRVFVPATAPCTR
jgi:hypothetical protein